MQTHRIILKEQDSAWPLAQQYPFAQNNRSLMVRIGFKQYAFVQSKTVDKEYNQSYHQNNQSYLYNNRILVENNTSSKMRIMKQDLML